jgi:transposase
VAALLPYLSAVQVEHVEPGEDLVSTSMRTFGGVPRCCPACGSASAREHSRYARQVADLGIGGRTVLIEVCVRRLYCANPQCPKATFVEQVPA